jgi:hypothetical protein
MSTDWYIIGARLRSIRRRRKLLWGVLLLYLPEIWLTLKLTHSNRIVAGVFCIWFISLWNSVMLVAFVRCPRCENYFHIKAFFPVYLRSCRHCGLHLLADKKTGIGSG